MAQEHGLYIGIKIPTISQHKKQQKLPYVTIFKGHHFVQSEQQNYLVYTQSCAWWGQIPNCSCPLREFWVSVGKPDWIVFSLKSPIGGRAKFFNLKNLICNYTFYIPNENYENLMGDFREETIQSGFPTLI